MNEIGESIRTQLINPRKGRDPRKAHLPRSVKQFPMPTTVNFSDALHGKTTVEVISQDRPGLLYQIAESFDACGIKMHNARIATYGAHVEDIFDVTDLGDKPLTDETQCECLKQQIASRLDDVVSEDAVIEF
jgi:[protein-PII] uridylyltransferase